MRARDNLAPNGLYQILRSNQYAAKQLPQPGEAWDTSSVPDELGAAIKRFAASDAIQCVGRVEERASNMRRYETTPAAYRIAQDLDLTTASCGHTGVQTIEAGEVYTCGHEDCDNTFGRDVAEEVLS